eukprot:7004402-Prymnesium_polylepis.1
MESWGLFGRVGCRGFAQIRIGERCVRPRRTVSRCVARDACEPATRDEQCIVYARDSLAARLFTFTVLAVARAMEAQAPSSLFATLFCALTRARMLPMSYV